MSLGVYQDYLGATIQAIVVDFNVWGVPGGIDNKMAVSIARMEAELFRWYSSDAAGGKESTRIQSLEVSLLGTKEAPTFKYHASETNGMLEFMVFFLAKHQARFPGLAPWLKLGKDLAHLR
eukprot:2328398-Alexandrium_andersonii.AAC.1